MLIQHLRRASKKQKSKEESVLSDGSSCGFDAIFDKYPKEPPKQVLQQIQPQQKPLDESRIINSLKENLAVLVREELDRREIKSQIKPMSPIPFPSAGLEFPTKSASARLVSMGTSITPQPRSLNSTRDQCGDSVKENKPNQSSRLAELEAQLAELKRQEKLEEAIIKREKEKQKRDQKAETVEDKFSVSFCAQATEEEIARDMKILHERNQDPSLPRDLDKNNMATQTNTVEARPPQAWYAPIYTERPVAIDRNALDSTKRLSDVVTKKASLQEAFLIKQQEFISRSRSRVRHVKLRQQQRLVEQEMEKERIKVFGDYRATSPGRTAKFKPVPAHIALGERRPINLKEARKATTEKYNKLPEVIERKRRAAHHRERMSNSVKVASFNKKIQNKVLSKL